MPPSCPTIATPDRLRDLSGLVGHRNDSKRSRTSKVKERELLGSAKAWYEVLVTRARGKDELGKATLSIHGTMCRKTSVVHWKEQFLALCSAARLEGKSR